jgi:hypothetical protein
LDVSFGEEHAAWDVEEKADVIGIEMNQGVET